MSSYADDVQFAGLVEAATAAADEHQRNLKRKREQDVVQFSIGPDLGLYSQPQPLPDEITLSQSAAVLFREPTEASKRYSRPPLGKVFNSLQLSPDAFLRLQAAAKDFMLDENHPERREVVGYKKLNENSDVAKLKLWGCVDDFLRHDDIGERFFGHHVTDVGATHYRTFFWPQDHQRIVKLLMPLLRKMVTNERQRLYAAQTRKKDGLPTVQSRQNRSVTDTPKNEMVSSI